MTTPVSSVLIASRVIPAINFTKSFANRILEGHTKVRCKEPLVEEDVGGDMDTHGGNGHGGFDSGFGSAPPAADDPWN